VYFSRGVQIGDFAEGRSDGKSEHTRRKNTNSHRQPERRGKVLRTNGGGGYSSRGLEKATEEKTDLTPETSRQGAFELREKVDAAWESLSN